MGGLARIKAPRIKAIVEEVWRRLGSFDLSFLQEMPLAEAKAWLRSLPGVGPKTAACVLMFALGMPALPVDTHVYRRGQAPGAGASAVTGAEKAHELLEGMLAPDEVYPFHMSLIRHGRRICKAQRPLCPQCPLAPAAPRRCLSISLILSLSKDERGAMVRQAHHERPRGSGAPREPLLLY